MTTDNPAAPGPELSADWDKSDHDGKFIAFVDTHEGAGEIRIYLNDYCIYYGNPETDRLPDAQRRAAEWERA